MDSKDSEERMSRTAWNRPEAAQAGDLLRDFLSQVAGLGSLNSSGGCAGTFHLWTSSDRHGLPSANLLAVLLLPTTSLTRWESM